MHERARSVWCISLTCRKQDLTLLYQNTMSRITTALSRTPFWMSCFVVHVYKVMAQSHRRGDVVHDTVQVEADSTYMTTNAVQHLNLTSPTDESSGVLGLACTLEHSKLAVMIALLDDGVICFCDDFRF